MIAVCMNMIKSVLVEHEEEKKKKEFVYGRMN